MAIFYIIPTGDYTGISSVSLGILRSLEQSMHKVAFFKPIAQRLKESSGIDISSHFSRQLFHLDTPDPISLIEAEDMINHGKEDDLIEMIVARFSQIPANQYNVAIIEGMVPDASRGYLVEKNKEIADSLNAEIVFIVGVGEMTPQQVVDNLKLHIKKYSTDLSNLGGFVLNNIPKNTDKKQFQKKVQVILGDKYDIPCIAAISHSPDKSARRVLDIVDYLQATVLNGAEKLANSRINEIVVAGQSAVAMVDRFKPNSLIVAPGDREDVLMAVALVVARGVPLAGLVLSCSSHASANLKKLISPILKDHLPVLITEKDTFETASALSKQSPHVPLDDKLRMESIVNYIAEHINLESFSNSLAKPKDIRLSPAAFRYRMIEEARKANKRIVLPEGDEPRTVQAAIICHQKKIARCVLLAKPETVYEVAEIHGLQIPDDLEILDPESIRSQYIEPLVEIRKNKGLKSIQAKEQLEDNVVIGTMMLAMNEVDGLVSGAVHTTANTIRPALQIIKTAPNASLVSSIFFMLMPEQVLIYGDCAVNPNPNAEQLADIAIQSADSAQAFGIDPRVAMISYSTGSSGSGDEVEKVKNATNLAQSKRPDLKIDGPLQYDAASVPSVGKQKAPNSSVAGQATVFVFPDLNTGNTTYKAVQRSANVLSVGPMLQGLNKAVNDLSRGASVDDIVYTIAITAIQSVQLQDNE